jgi:hypothetical protein
LLSCPHFEESATASTSANAKLAVASKLLRHLSRLDGTANETAVASAAYASATLVSMPGDTLAAVTVTETKSKSKTEAATETKTETEAETTEATTSRSPLGAPLVPVTAQAHFKPRMEDKSIQTEPTRRRQYETKRHASYAPGGSTFFCWSNPAEMYQQLQLQCGSPQKGQEPQPHLYQLHPYQLQQQQVAYEPGQLAPVHLRMHERVPVPMPGYYMRPDADAYRGVVFGNDY